MAIRIEQDYLYSGDHWWKWSVWIEGPDDELDAIKEVVYTLHESFVDPVRVVRDRATKFRLDTSGWGTFRIYARVVTTTGSSRKLHHDLVLAYPDGSPTAA
jgi:transcription initiation factor IIF auxiliary subunit